MPAVSHQPQEPATHSVRSVTCHGIPSDGAGPRSGSENCSNVVGFSTMDVSEATTLPGVWTNGIGPVGAETSSRGGVLMDKLAVGVSTGCGSAGVAEFWGQGTATACR